MDIKERFYANLDVIREQMGSPPVSARPVMNRPTPIRPSGPPTRPVMNRPMDNKSFVDRSSSPQDVAQKAKQKASSFGGLNWQERSALGVDMQEAEQLDETQDSLSGGLRRTDRSDLDKQIDFHNIGLANSNYKGVSATHHRKVLRKLMKQKESQEKNK